MVVNYYKQKYFNAPCFLQSWLPIRAFGWVGKGKSIHSRLADDQIFDDFIWQTQYGTQKWKSDKVVEFF